DRDAHGNPFSYLVKLSGALAGKRLVVKDTPASHRLVLRAIDPTVLGASPDGPGDPTLGGAVLILSNPGTGETATIPLPAANWRRTVARPGAFTYTDPTGTCSKIALTAKRSLVTRCSAFAFSLDEASQGTLALRLTTGSGPSSVDNCLRFGGTVL